MEVILRHNVEQLGRAGDVVEVRDGYARNYLIPRGLAYRATEENRRRAAAEARRRVERATEQHADAESLAARLDGLELHFTMRAGEGDKLFGSVTAADIAAKLAEHGWVVDKRNVELDEPIKLIGVYRVPVRVHADVRTQLRVWVVRE